MFIHLQTVCHWYNVTEGENSLDSKMKKVISGNSKTLIFVCARAMLNQIQFKTGNYYPNTKDKMQF